LGLAISAACPHGIGKPDGPDRVADGVIAGHGRLLAARKLGMAEVPVIALGHLTAAQRRARSLQSRAEA
jgi:hypothetical protein